MMNFDRGPKKRHVVATFISMMLLNILLWGMLIAAIAVAAKWVIG